MTAKEMFNNYLIVITKLSKKYCWHLTRSSEMEEWWWNK